jgi:hypothetical protein
MRTVAVLLILAAVTASSALGATISKAALEKTLKAGMVKKFKTEAPKLKITKVTCTVAKSGTTAQCKGYFTDAGVKGYYPVSTTISGTSIKWVAQQPKCLYTKTYSAC